MSMDKWHVSNDGWHGRRPDGEYYLVRDVDAELARLRRIEQAAREVIKAMGLPLTDPHCSAVYETLRAALEAKP